MPLVILNPGIGGSPIFAANRPRTLQADGSVSAGVQFHESRNRAIYVNGTVFVSAHASTHLGRTRTLYAHLRSGTEPNVFGSIEIERVRVADFGSSPVAGGKAILPRVRRLSVASRVARAESDTLNILLTIADDAPAGFGNTYSARVYADGVAYAIKAFQYSEDRGSVGVALDLTLVKPSDRSAIEAASSFRFDVYDGGTWTTLFDAGKRTGTGYAIAFSDGRPTDSLSISTNGDVDNKLRKSPESNTTVFDASRLTLTAADFDRIYDTDGNVFVQDLEPIAGLDLYALLNYVFVIKCGFSGYRTTIPNFLIRRADFSFTGSFFDGIAGHVGAYSPLLFVKDDIVWLIDSTAPFPPGFGSPAPLNASEYIDAQFQQTDVDLDGYLVQFADNETDYDYTTNRFVDDPAEISGVFGSPNYTETERHRTYRDYFKISNPLVPVRSEKIRDVKETSGIVNGTLITMATETEDLSFDSFGRVKFILKDYSGLVPDLANPAVDGSFPLVNRTIKLEKTQFLYGPDRLAPVRQILKQTIKEVSGLVTIDTQKQHLGKDFKQEFTDGFAAGNLDDTLIVDQLSISTTTETIDQNDKGQFEIRTRVVNFLTDPPHIQTTTTDARSGDMSTNASTGGTNEIVVFRPGATRTNANFGTLAVAEVPVQLATALARRKLAKRKIRQGSVTLKGLRLSIGRGTMFELFTRDNVSAGVFVCEGRQISGGSLGTREQTTRQVLEVTEI